MEQVPLHAWVLEQVGAGARVLLLARDEVLAERLVAAGCTVLDMAGASESDSPLAEMLGWLAPTHVVLSADGRPAGLPGDAAGRRRGRAFRDAAGGRAQRGLLDRAAGGALRPGPGGTRGHRGVPGALLLRRSG